MTRAAFLLVLLALASCGTDAPAAVGATGDCDAARDWPAPDRLAAARLRDLVNTHRASRGLAALRDDPRLDAAAEWKARHMARHRYLDHDDRTPPLRRSFAARIAACGFAGLGTAENIAAGDATPEAVMRTWLASAGHRRNMEGPAYTHLGVGAARAADGRPHWTQVFGRAAM